MFERFTERARQVVVLAQDEARRLGQDYIGTEHILLGLMREEEGLAAQALAGFGLSLDELRADIARIVGEAEAPPTGQIPFTPRSKRVLEHSLPEAIALSHNYIGTEHVLLGLLREGEGVAVQLLREHSLEPEAVRAAVIELLGGTATGDLSGRRRRRFWGGEPPTFASPPRQAWDYLVVPLGVEEEPSVATLDDLGAEGWELCTSLPMAEGVRLVFKRPR